MNNKLFFMRDITLFITLYVLLTANLSATVKNEFSPVDSLSGTPWCIDDIAIEMNYFQPVQVVWNDDPDFDS